MDSKFVIRLSKTSKWTNQPSNQPQYHSKRASNSMMDHLHKISLTLWGNQQIEEKPVCVVSLLSFARHTREYHFAFMQQYVHMHINCFNVKFVFPFIFCLRWHTAKR